MAVSPGMRDNISKMKQLFSVLKKLREHLKIIESQNN